MIKHLLVASISALFLCNGSNAEHVYNESDGLVIMEVENTESPLGLWKKETSLSGYTGSGYLEFTGNSYEIGKVHSPLIYNFKINQGGIYVLDLHCAKMTIKGRTDWANDCFVRVVGDYTSGEGSHDVPNGNASLNLLKTDTKFFGGKSDAWEWASGDFDPTGGRLDPGGKKNKRKAVYNFKSGETYTLVLSGRSKGFRVDRIVFRLDSVRMKEAQDLGKAESKKIEGTPPDPDSLDRPFDAVKFDIESHSGDDDVIKQDGSFVSNIKDGSWICFKDFDFGVGAGGCVEVQAASANEEGGIIEMRTDSATGPLLGTLHINKTWAWGDYEYSSVNLATVSGKKDLYLVFKGGDGNLINLKSFMILSGVLVDEKPPTPPIRPPVGRVAYVADGNSPDPDDIGGTSAALAMLRAAGLSDRLVYCAHSCDLVKASNISVEKELSRQKMLQTACDGTASRWGGFDGLIFWNCRTQQTEAVNALKEQINASSESDPLWIIEAGEPDIIGYALEAADPAKRPYVKLLTHHSVNDGSGDFFKWGQILKFGVEEVRIPDQNGYNADIGKGLQRPLWAFYWARDHQDPRIQWLWQQGKSAEEDGVVGFQKGKFDISDAGMIFYWITGANMSPEGYREATVHDVRKLLENYMDKDNEKITP